MRSFVRSFACASSLLFALACGGDDDTVPFPPGSGGSSASGGASASGGSSSGGSAGAPAGSEKRLVVLFTSDEHSHLFSFSPELDDFPAATEAGGGPLIGGVARRKTMLDAERGAAKAAGKGVVTVSGGDNQMGGLSQVGFTTEAVDYGALFDLGYDATCLGNHEFDFGPKRLAQALGAAQAKDALVPVVTSNLHFSDSDAGDDDLAAAFSATPGDGKALHPYHVVTTDNGLKVGFLGVVGVNASHVAPNKAPAHFSEVAVAAADENDETKVLPAIYADLQPVVDTLRNTEKCDVVVLLSHAGQRDPDPTKGEDAQIGANVSGIDLIVSGHAHNDDPTPVSVTNAKSGKTTVVLNASSYGRHVGEVEIAVAADGTTSVDLTTQKLMPVTEATVPDATEAQKLGPIVSTLEGASFTSDAPPYLATLLSRATGQSVTDQPDPGDLYFYPLASTDYDLDSTHAILFLTADAQLTAANAVEHTDFALQSGGVTRNLLAKGKTGVIAAADAFSIVPLGQSPVDGTLGYPLVRANVPLLVVLAIFELSSAVGPTDGDYDLMPAGALVEYDCSRPAAATVDDVVDPSKGRVTKISIDTDPSDGFEQYDTVIYDRATTQQADLLTKSYSVATSLYIAGFASAVGATLYDDAGQSTTPAASILHRADGSEIKEVEGFFSYLKGLPGGKLPATYDASADGRTKRFDQMKFCQ